MDKSGHKTLQTATPTLTRDSSLTSSHFHISFLPLKFQHICLLFQMREQSF